MSAVAFVTGVSRGLGEAIARLLVARGWDVVGFGRTASHALSSQRAFRLVWCDLSDAAIGVHATAAFDEAAARAPTRALLVNNAAVADPIGRYGTLPDEAIEDALAVNLVAPAILCNRFCAAFASVGIDRRIVNVSSGAAVSTLPGASTYCVAKAGLEMLTRSLADEHRDPGFRAIAVRPGVVDTGMQTAMRGHSSERLPVVDLFRGFHANGMLVSPDAIAARIVDRLVEAPVEHGRIYSHHELD